MEETCREATRLLEELDPSDRALRRVAERILNAHACLQRTDLIVAASHVEAARKSAEGVVARLAEAHRLIAEAIATRPRPAPGAGRPLARVSAELRCCYDITGQTATWMAVAECPLCGDLHSYLLGGGEQAAEGWFTSKCPRDVGGTVFEVETSTRPGDAVRRRREPGRRRSSSGAV